MKRSVLIAVSLCLAQPAFAANDTGFYLGAGLASGTLSACTNTTGSCNTFTNHAEESGHLWLVGGYDFNRYVGIEAGLSGLGSYKVQDIAGATAGTVKASAITVAARGGYTFPHGFSIFGKLGLARVRTQYTADPGYTLNGDADQRSTGVVLGAGGQYNFNRAFGIRLYSEIVTFKDSGYTGAVGGTSLMAVFKF
jgi:hypothetical protein